MISENNFYYSYLAESDHGVVMRHGLISGSKALVSKRLLSMGTALM
jgi:hypothetical protein